MGASRFPRPETVTIPISDGDTITLRKRVTVGERRAAFAFSYVRNGDGELHYDPLRSPISTVMEYLVDWTCRDDNGPVVIAGKPLEEIEAALLSIDTDSFKEIRDAVTAHEKSQEKKLQAGESASSQTSTLPADAAGLTTT